MIFYFSGTGNTRWAAETVARAMGERLVDMAAELRKGAADGASTDADDGREEPSLSTDEGELSYDIAEGESVGIFYPVHGWQPPALVRRFIKRLNILGNPFVYSLCTCGDTVGDAMTILSKELAARGLQLRAAYSLVMPESYVCLPFMYTDTPEREREKCDTAARLLDEIIERIRQGRQGSEMLKTGPTPRLYSYVIGAYFNRFMISDRKFSVDASACISCRRCASVCPTGDIAFENAAATIPIWRHDGLCTCCLACYHHCPTHAINYGSITRKRGQYYYGHGEKKQ